MLLSAAMISFRRIMLNININTYTIDFSSLPALKEREFQSREKGDSIALNLIWWFHVSIDILKFRLVWSPVQYPCLTPSSDFFSSEREMHYSEGSREALISLPTLSFTNYLQPLPAEPQRVSAGSVLQHFHGEERPSMWVFNGNPTPRVSFGLNKGQQLCKGGLCDCSGDKISCFAGRSEFTCCRGFILNAIQRNIKKRWWEVVQSEIKSNCDWCWGERWHLIHQRTNWIPIYSSECVLC